MKGVYRTIVLPDLQLPYEDRKAVSAVERYMADETWDEWIQLGDFMDFDCISSFNRTALRKVEGKTLADDYAYANDFLDRHQRIVRKRNRKAKFTLLEGNHDQRIERYVDEFPQLRNTVEVERGLNLAERGIGWIRCWSKGEFYKVGKCAFTHGLYTNAHHAKRMADSFGGNVVYGHTHDVQGHSKVLWGADKTIVGQSLGCLCRYDQDYIGKNPTNWQHAFGVMYFMPDGHFQLYVVRIMGGRFIAPNGKAYGP